MKVLFTTILVILVFLAISSGTTKIMLMPQDVSFFGQYRFTNSILIVYGIAQLIGGILLAIPTTRAMGAIIVAMTFLISAVVLMMADNIPMSAITLIFVVLLAFVIKKSLQVSDDQIEG